MLYTLLTENDAHYREPLQQQFPDRHFHVRPGVWLVAATDTMAAIRSSLTRGGRDVTDDGLVILAVSGWFSHKSEHLVDWLSESSPRGS